MMSRAIKKVTLSCPSSHCSLPQRWCRFCSCSLIPLRRGASWRKTHGEFRHSGTFSNYSSLVSFNSGILVRTFFNSVFVSVVYTLLTLIVSSLAAFAFSKYSFRGKNVIFIFPAGDDDDSGGDHDSGDLPDVQQGTHA